MTIKELEQLLDMPRANIRYYEQEGLISPARAENGYREYSEEDVQTLERIRLLRALNCTVSDIRDIKEGKAVLAEVLRAKREDFLQIEAKAVNAREVCEAISQAGVQFATLDAKKYLSGAWREQQPARPIEVPREELVQISPWRRFFARMLDWYIYTGIWKAAAAFIFPAGTAGYVDIAVGEIVMLLLEPLLLHLWGTTPGKRLLGLTVTAENGEKLSLEQARSRTWGVLMHGCWFNVPVLELVGMGLRYRDVKNGEQLRWEYDSCVVQKDAHTWRTCAYIAMRVMLALALICCAGLGRMPMHRGMLTPEEFAENYNDLLWKYGIEAYEMNADGTWKERNSDSQVNVIVIGGRAEDRPKMEMDVRDGYVRGFTLRMDIEAEEADIYWLPIEQMRNAATALCAANSPWYHEMWILGSDAYRIARKTDTAPDEPWELQLGNRWQISYDVQYHGMHFMQDSGGMMISNDGRSSLSLTFEVQSME